MILAVGPLVSVLVVASPDDVTRAHARADLDEVARIAASFGADGIAPMLTAADASVAHAGIAAAPHAPDAWELLLDLAVLSGDWDRSRAAPAARAALRIAHALDGDAAILLDMPDDLLAASQAAWADVADRPDRWADVRVHALEITTRIATARRATADDDPGRGYALDTVLTDADPEVRRAACELVVQPTPATARPGLAVAIADDPDPAVVLACAQALCADLAFDPPAPVLAALGDAGAARLRDIFTGALPEVPAGALVDAARCLAARDSREDAAALRSLSQKAPRQIRSMLSRAIRHGKDSRR